ncbi:hypothetical protein BSKO_10134 [Bryopsis sp. KO-2023]|nr:hypothetical protein BSKO_10134 [Bryopsis sp. KO-2023]
MSRSASFSVASDTEALVNGKLEGGETRVKPFNVEDDVGDKREKWRARSKTMVALNLAAVVERAEEQILPAMYSVVGEAFGAKPKALGALTLSRALSQALCSPIGGLLGFRYSRVKVIAAGCFIWSLMTVLFSFTNSLPQGMVLWAINGFGLSLVIPSVQSLTADYFDSSNRGKAFGLLYFTGAFGAMAGQIYATNIGSSSVNGWAGWRFVMLSVGVYSGMIGALTLLLATDPRENVKDRLSERRPWRETMKAVASVVKVPTFLLIIIQGVFGNFPWQALVYMTLYFQLIGMSNFSASFLVALFLGLTSIGAVIGGALGDIFAERFPKHGRVFVAQFSVGIKLPFVIVLMHGMPRNGETTTVALYAVLLGFMGLLAPWAASACNNPIFAEIVPPSHRNLVYSFDRSFEMSLSALAAPLVGLMAEKFGYSGTVKVTGESDKDLPNASALRDALFFWLMVPWTICFLLYTAVHWTYPHDKAKDYVALREDNPDQAVDAAL